MEDVVNKYLDCGDLSKGFARLHCAKCNKDYLLAFSCIRLRPAGYAVTRASLVAPALHRSRECGIWCQGSA